MENTKLDFTSSLYLGFRHSRADLPTWSQLTMGVPVVLNSAAGTRRLEERLASLIGCESALMGTSTFHLFWDLFKIIGKPKTIILKDEKAYPVAGWGIERVQNLGIPVETFSHLNRDDLMLRFRSWQRKGYRPIVVTDGYCAQCGRHAPLADYLNIISKLGGRLVIDDTQSLGIWGTNPQNLSPLGYGGGGSLRRFGIAGPEIVVVNSLAKGFGAPLAVIAGSHSIIEKFKVRSKTRVHTSPPDSVSLQAAARAVDINRTRGNRLREHLVKLLRIFRKGIAGLGLMIHGNPFPLQVLTGLGRIATLSLHKHLFDRGIQTLLLRHCSMCGPAIGIIVNSRHSINHIQYLIGEITRALQSIGKKSDYKVKEAI